MMSQQAQIAEDISKIILSIKPGASSNFQNDMKSYSQKVLRSYVSRQVIQSPQQIKDKIMAKVSNNLDNKSTLQCQQTINKIMTSSAIQKKPEILKMLYKTSELLNKGKNFSNVFKDTNVSTLNQTQDTTNISQSVYMNNSSTASFLKNKKNVNQGQGTPQQDRGSASQGISETDILKQILYTLQNIQSSFITQAKEDANSQSQGFMLKANIQASSPIRKMVRYISDIGWLFKKIISNINEKSCIEKSLALAVHQQLNEYYRWLAVIQNSIKNGQLTMRLLVSWSYQPLQKLKWIATILDVIQPYKGCQIISVINSYRPQGSQSIKALLDRILSFVVQPLLQYIYNWIYKGQLIDDHKQFFVVENKRIDENLTWYEKFSLVESNIPDILDKQSAFMIFDAGKTIYFLKNNCNFNYSNPVPFVNTKNILNRDICDSLTILSQQFKKWLKTVYKDSSEKLVEILVQNFNFKYHLQSMKNFYLIGKGDFIQHLIDSLKQEMAKGKHLIYQTTLDGYISDATSKCFTDFKIKKQQYSMIHGKQLKASSYKANVIDRLLAFKVDYGDGSWDCFNFQYSMDKIQPLYCILTPESFKNYRKIFHFLWKVKRIEQMLKQIWLIHQKEYPKDTRSKQFVQFSCLLRRCYKLRANMNHFVSNFYGYLMIAVESAWDNFYGSVNPQKQGNTCLSIDNIIFQHIALQRQLLDITFNTQSRKILLQKLQSVFKVIEQFRHLEDSLQNSYLEYFQRLRHYQNRRKIMSKGIIDLNQDQLEIPTFDQNKISDRLQQIQQVYGKTFKAFYDSLQKDKQTKSEEKNASNNIDILFFRLDYSEYYANLYMSEDKREKSIF